jgi:capsular exopolysaccharide synthesis family protein
VSEHAALLEAYGPDHPDLTACLARIHDTSGRLDACRRRLSEVYLAAAQQRSSIAQARADQLRGPYAAQQDLASDANAKAIEYDLLRAEVQRRERISEILDNRIKEIDVTGDAGALDISVLEWADAASAPVHPQRSRIFGLALVLGVVLGIIGASVWEWADDRLRTAADVTRRIGLPVLGEVPHLVEKAELGGAAEPSLTTKMSEACQTVRTALDWAAQNGGLQTVLVSSPGHGDGKSTLASSLALVLARAGKRTLVIDADMRSPGQHQIFGVEASPGLEGLLAREIPFAAAIRPTLIDGLDVLPSGSPPTNPTELLSNERFQHLLELLKLEYEFVLIDAPAVLEFADAAVVGSRTDGALLVVRAAHSTGGGVAQACAALERVGAGVVGTVLNDVGCGQRAVRQRGVSAAA